MFHLDVVIRLIALFKRLDLFFIANLYPGQRLYDFVIYT